jgi:hypothetical protein
MQNGLSFRFSIGNETRTQPGELDEFTIPLLRNIKTIEGVTVQTALVAESSGPKSSLIPLDSLIITAISAGAVTAIIEVLKEWVSRKAGRTITLKVQRGNESIEATLPLDYEKNGIMLADELIRILNSSTSPANRKIKKNHRN